MRLNLTRMVCISGLFAVMVLNSGCLQSRKSKLPPQQGSALQEFGYHHAETTGISEFVLVNGKEIAIEFDSNSDRGELEGLRHEFDGPENHIVVVGKLSPIVKRTPDGSGFASSEPYQEFQLVQWRKVPKDYKPEG